MKPQCLNPFIRETPQLVDELGFPLKQAFPCGKCPICVASDSKDWMLRLQVEKDNSFNSHFITLTYNEKNIVRNGSVGILVKRDIQLFLKRLRKRIADKFPDSPKLRFFAVGEYGPTTLRPHYHAIIFNLPTDCNLHRLIEGCWSKGFVTISPVTGNRIAYVASYSMFTFLFNPMGDTSVQNPFRIMSRRPGIGEKFITAERHRYYQSHFDGITYKGFKYRFPRFYKDRLFDSVESKEQYGLYVTRHRKESEYIDTEVCFEIDKSRLVNRLPTIAEEQTERYIEGLKKKYVQHKLHRKV